MPLNRVLDPIFGDPTAGAHKYLDQVPGIEHQYYDPYYERGSRAGDFLEGQYGMMAGDPSAYLSEILSNYRASPGFRLKMKEALDAARGGAAAGGMAGTTQDLSNQVNIEDRLMNEDINQLLGIAGKGLEGEQSFYNTGYGAAQNLEQGLSNLMGTEAGLEFSGDKERNKRMSDMLGMFVQMLGAGNNGGS